MIAKYGGDSESDGVVTCKISSEILEPHFSLSPVRLREYGRSGGVTIFVSLTKVFLSGTRPFAG